MNMGLDLASELHWLAFRKRVCHVKSWKQTTGCAFPEASKPAHLCTGEYGLSWYGVEDAYVKKTFIMLRCGLAGIAITR